MTEIPKQFEYSEAEARIYRLWEENNIFRAEVKDDRPAFCVVIPPPNVTGILHMGHVLDNVPQDIMTRWHRMRGFSALWVPGTDHAGIATQNVVERQLAKEGLTAKELGREAFVERVWKWREKHGSIILEQLKRLGCSCDWSRERFTMDEHLSRAVVTAFLHYYERGLIYRGKRMINWCPRCHTALADDEVEHQERSSKLWYLRYPIEGEPLPDGTSYLVVATTRPETMLGDTAVAVNPQDERYARLVGRHVVLPLKNRKIPVIADAFVDPQFGTGVVKVTPAHDPNDYQMGLAHKLEFDVVIGDDGRMTASAGPRYEGLDRMKARECVLEDLSAQDLVEKIEPYRHSVGQCYRCHTVVVPLISAQWFVNMRPLAETAQRAVEEGRVQILPESEKHDYFNWLNNIQDWCISRQLWWGHRIPIYYCDDCKEVMAKAEAPQRCEKCASSNIRQDEDVLDTWFSAQLWPFSTLGWPDKTPELAYWYPNSWLMSGRDILFFWDTRMIMAGLELLGDVPFRVLALHGLARDEHGRKLSKSLGNSRDPLDLFSEYGTDAIRASIVQRYPMGRQDVRLNERVYQEGRSLVTKLWNAARLVMMSLPEGGLTFDSSQAVAAFEDRWILSRVGRLIETHDKLLAENDFAHALEALTNFFWDEYCDWYLEIIKPRLRDEKQRNAALAVALTCQRTLFQLLHPYIPFVTEELWQILRQRGVRDVSSPDEPCLAISSWPSSKNYPAGSELGVQAEIMMSLVRGVRDIRHNLSVAPKEPLVVKLSFHDQTDAAGFEEYHHIVCHLAALGECKVSELKTVPVGCVPLRVERGVAFITLPDGLDIQSLTARLAKKAQQLEKNLCGAERQLANEAFMKSAPVQVVEETRRKASEYAEALAKLREFQESLQS
jgi:valyl-tRNA synthetase